MENNNDITYIGETNYRGVDKPIGIKTADRRQHVHILGKTGVGKSRLIRNLIIQDINAGHAVGVIDPHGDLADELLDYIPKKRIYDLVYLDAGDLENPLGFNLLDDVSKDEIPLVISGVVSAFKNIWSDSWGPRLEYYLANTVGALLDYQEPTNLLDISKFLSDENHRRKTTRKLNDPMLKMFWEKEFNQKDKRFNAEAVAPIQNKVGQFLNSSTIRNIVGQNKSTFTPKYIMDNNGIFIANLSKGKIGEDKAHLLGALLITKFQLCALARAHISESERQDFFLHIDETQNFLNDSFLSIFSEARKYKLSLSLSHQFLDQLGEDIQKALLGNVGTLISFRIGNKDAEVMAREFEKDFNPDNFTDLGKYEMYMKLLEDGIALRSYPVRTYAEVAEKHNLGKHMKNVSRKRFGRSREKVERTINKWLSH